MRLPAVVAVGLASALVPAAPARAQSWRTINVARQLHDFAALRVRVDYAAGRLRIGAARDALLYDVRLRYDEDRFEPVRAFDEETRTLHVGNRARGAGFVKGRGELGELALSLGSSVPLDLDLDLGAVEADLDLTDLTVERLRLQAGASETRVRFGTPNPERMRSLELRAGAATIRASLLGNANAERIHVDCDVGTADLDFGGAWTGDLHAVVSVTLGAVTLRVPRDVGVRLRLDKLLASFDTAGLTRRDGAYYTENWDTATRRLSVQANTTFGRLRLER